MSVIGTLALNPSVDKTLEMDSLLLGGTNRVKHINVCAGGKGVNVALSAAALGLKANCLLLLGKNGAELFTDTLSGGHVNAVCVYQNGSPRTNCKLLYQHEITEINEQGIAAEETHLREITRQFAAMASQCDVVVLTGSLPPNCPQNIYGELMQTAQAKCILDCAGEALLQGLTGNPWLVKPNADELAAWCGHRADNMQGLVSDARKMVSAGAENVLVSLGKDGVLFVSHHEAMYTEALKVDVENTVGAGDTMLAGFVYGIGLHGDVREALRWSVAAASAKIESDKPYLCGLARAAFLKDRVAVREVLK